MTTFTYPTPNNSLKSMALAALGASGIAVATVYRNTVWSYAAGALTQTGASGVGYPTSGYASAATDVSGNAYSTQITGSLVEIASGSHAVTASALFDGLVYLGTAYSPAQNAVYVIASDGSIYTVSGSSVLPTPINVDFRVTTSGDIRGLTDGSIRIVTGTDSRFPEARGLETSGSTLFTMLPVTGQLGFFTLTGLTSGTSGVVSTPMTVPSCIAASSTASAVAVGGWNFSSIGSGFVSIAPAPNSLSVAGVTSGGIAAAWGIINGSWGITSTVSGLGSPKFLGWAPTGTNLLVDDPTGGRTYSLTYSLGTLALTQTIVVSGAAAVGITTDSAHALVCQTSLNTITPMSFSGTTWTSGATFAIGSPTSVITTGASGAVIGCSSGLAIASMSSGGTWTITSTGAVGFTPAYMARDSSGNIYAAGTSGASGMFAVVTSGLSITGSGSFVGSVSGLVYTQGQLVLADAVNAYCRVFGNVGGSWSQQATGAAVVGLDSIAYATTSNDFFAAGSTVTNQYKFIAPYTLSQSKTGSVSIYKAGVFNTLALSASAVPQAITFDPSGNVSVVTLQNTLITVTSGGVMVGSSGIPQQVNQPSTTPIGLSDLIWVNGVLWGSSSLCDALIQVKP